MEWDEPTVRLLRDLWAQGHSTAEIGRRLKVSKNSVVGKAHRLDLDARPSPIRGVKSDLPSVQSVPRLQVTLPPLPSEQPEPAASVLTPGGRIPTPAAQPRPVMPPAQPIRLFATTAIVPPRPSLIPTPIAVVEGPPVERARPVKVGCCWPIGHPGTKAFRFCDAKAKAGRPYCAEHCDIAYIKIRDRREGATV